LNSEPVTQSRSKA